MFYFNKRIKLSKIQLNFHRKFAKKAKFADFWDFCKIETEARLLTGNIFNRQTFHRNPLEFEKSEGFFGVWSTVTQN